LTNRITEEKLWRVQEIIIRPGYPRDVSLRVKRSIFSPEIDFGSAWVEVELRAMTDYDILRLLATASSTEEGFTLRGMPS
jgi:hypothetical protein